MTKIAQNSWIFYWFDFLPLSILESRKHNQAVVCLNSGGLQSRSTPQRIGLCREAGSSKRGLRKSSSLTNGMSPGRNKTALREYGIEARGLICLHIIYICLCVHSGHPLMRTVLR